MGPMRLLILSAVFAASAAADGSVVLAQTRAELGFSSAVSERLMDAYARRFGPAARTRLASWKRYAAQHRGATGAEEDLLRDVNRTLNRIRFVDDSVHWGQADYWATPAESVASDGADCEDFAIAKYFLLKELGIPIARLRMTYVKAVKLNQPHMVLAYYPRPDAEPLVLDNLEDVVRPASQRPDLIPVYSFNDEQVWVETRGRSGSPRQIRNWNLLMERLERELRS
jgi:predicted transglutaminase-like cysteine proteinase